MMLMELHQHHYLQRFFNYIKHPYIFFIPERERDGYGPSKLTI